jgi:hypothetical protein
LSDSTNLTDIFLSIDLASLSDGEACLLDLMLSILLSRMLVFLLLGEMTDLRIFDASLHLVTVTDFLVLSSD